MHNDFDKSDNVLKTARKNNLTREQLAEKLGITSATLYLLRTKITNPIIASFFGLSAN